MIRVCHVTSVHSFDDDRIFHKECKSLSKNYDVTLIAPNVKSFDKDGIHIVGVPLPKSRFKRACSLSIVLKAMINVDADVYHFHDPELMRLGLNLKRMGKKIIFDSHEDVPQQILTKSYIPSLLRNPLSILYSVFEKFCLKRFDALVSVTPYIVRRLETISSNVYQITNYPLINNNMAGNDITKDDRRICFAGGVTPQYMHENIIKSIVGLDVSYWIAGAAPQIYLNKLKSLPGWNQVNYVGKIPFEQVEAFLKASTCGMAILDYTPNVGGHQGSLGVIKFFEYLSAGIPVIATDFDVWKTVIDKYNCGICVNPYDVNEISLAVKKLLDNPELAKTMGMNGRRAVEAEYNWKTQEKVLFHLYKELLQS